MFTLREKDVGFWV